MERLETEIYLRYKQIMESQGVGASPSMLCSSRASSCHPRAPSCHPRAPSCHPREGGDLSEKFAKRESRYTRMQDLLDRYDAFCFDGYGTLYNRGSFVYGGAQDWYTMLRAAGKQMRLITNAASDVDAVLAADAAKRGFAFSEAETVSSGSLLKDLCAELRGRGLSLREVYYIGRETGKHVLENCGIAAVAPDAEPAEPVVAISSAKDTPETYARAVEILRRPGAVLLVLNSDAWAPKIPEENGVTVREPVSGALCERLRRDSVCAANGMAGCETFYLGKPFPAIWDKVKRTLPEGARVLMVGDTLGTDVLGAKVAGFDSALVVGRNVPETELEDDEIALGIKPDWYL